MRCSSGIVLIVAILLLGWVLYRHFDWRDAANRVRSEPLSGDWLGARILLWILAAAGVLGLFGPIAAMRWRAALIPAGAVLIAVTGLLLIAKRHQR